jgi:type II secretory pathway predicted ATPase ExeA
MTLKKAIKEAKLSYRPLAKALGIAPTALCRLVNFGEYPARMGREAAISRIAEILERRSLMRQEIEWPEAGVRPGAGSHRERATGAHTPISTEAIELMQMDRSVLQLFGLRVNPFQNDVETDEDVFRSKGHDQVATAIKDAIEQRGFLAVVAPSGAGKTTIWDGIEAEYGRREDTVICRPMLTERERVRPDHIARALLFGLLGENARIYREGEQRGRQLASALVSAAMGTQPKKVILYIDDAHFCSGSVIRQIKTFFEQKIGRYRLLSIVLVGLPELEISLAKFPEVGNRIRLVKVPPVPVA